MDRRVAWLVGRLSRAVRIIGWPDGSGEPAGQRIIWLLVLLLTCLGLVGCGQPIPPQPTASQNRPLDAGVEYLLSQQGADGAWRSDTYANFRDGTALTPLVLNALLAAPPSAPRDAAIRKGADFLAGVVGEDGVIDAEKHRFPYPAYIAANAVAALCQLQEPKYTKARDGWLAYLRERQLTEELGWQPTDLAYGGWGYCPVLPRKLKLGEFGPPFVESNLSATLYALEALRAAGVPADDPAIQKALVFVERCQNYSEKPEPNDGGFFFIYNDPVRNKAGVAGPGRYHSYGSTTADGVRCLLLCGLKPEHPRVVAGRQWLVAHFRADTHPGKYEEGRELNREAIYFYYCASATQSLRTLNLTEAGGLKWSEALTDELTRRQRPDGSWSNPSHAFREDDPLTATSFAVLALARCR